MELLTLATADVLATQELAGEIGRQCKAGDCILLHGELGAGKTAFARGFIEALCGPQDEIVSPTFTLVQTYKTLTGDTIWHFDLYRLRTHDEIIELGLEDALASGITLIEWPDLVQSECPAQALEVHIAYGEHEAGRIFSLRGDAKIWQQRLAGLKGRQG